MKTTIKITMVIHELKKMKMLSNLSMIYQTEY
jgi:hypothetical protein